MSSEQKWLSWPQAREIMGQNFFDPNEAINSFGIESVKKWAMQFGLIPCSELFLKAHQNTHVLVAVFPLSVKHIRDQKGDLFCQPNILDNDWAFTNESGECGWHLVRKNEVPESLGKNWDDEVTLLGPDDVVPSAQVLTYSAIGMYLAHGIWLFKNARVRSSSRTSVGRHVFIHATPAGLVINDYSDDTRENHLGLASAKILSPES